MRKNNTVVELTPLLDVILIILFFILVQSTGRFEAMYAETREAFEEELEAYIAEFGNEVDDLRQAYFNYNELLLGLEEGASTILISIESDAGNPDIRSILVESMNMAAQIELNWDGLARDNASMALNAAIAEQVSGDAVTFVVFRFDSGSVFMADHQLVRLAIHNQRLQSPQMFFSEIDMRQN